MKNVIRIFFLFISMSFYGQNDTISVVKTSNSSVVSADKMNVVYRGLPNPISIAVPNCKSFTATAQGLSKVSEGKYILIPGSGLETIIILDIILNDGSSIKEEHKFRIKNSPRISGAINGLICNQSIILMCKEELKNATISIDFPKDFFYELKFNLKQFVVKIGNQNIVIIGTKFNKKAIDIIEKLPLNSIFEIQDLKSDINCDNCLFPLINPIKIMIIEDKNYEEHEDDK